MVRLNLRWPVAMICGAAAEGGFNASSRRVPYKFCGDFVQVWILREVGRIVIRSIFRASAAALFVLTCVPSAAASEAELVLPDLSSQTFLGMDGRALLMIGLLIALAGAVFGIMTFIKLRNLPVHRSMRDVSELIY